MPRIILVDDDYDAVFTFKYVLESYNYEVDGFTDPILALKTFSGEMLLFIIHKNTNAGLIKYMEESPRTVDLFQEYVRTLRMFRRRERHVDELQKLQRILYFVR
jgi:hypothetical protein